MRDIDITADMTIEDMIERYPLASGLFLRFGIKCFTCSGIIWGTIEETLRRKGVEDIEGTVEQLRRYIAERYEVEASNTESCDVGSESSSTY